jgi:hypothetical protein
VINYTLATTATQYSDAVTYPIEVTLGSNPNYTLTPVNGTLTITKKQLTVTANNKSKFFGAADPAFDANYAGFVGGQGPGVIDTPATCGVSVPHALAGTYPIDCLGALDNNYSFAYVPGTLTVTGYVFAGFFQPIDNTVSPLQKVWNSTKAGQAVPVKWRLLLGGVPVSSLPSFEGVYSMQVSCGTGGDMVNAIEEGTTGASGLQYLGDGNFHYNWKTPTAYKNTCRAMYGKFNDGSTSQIAYFMFK